MRADDAHPHLTFATSKDWRRWLAEHHAHVPGIWLQFAKKASGVLSVTYVEALAEALCYGWIDGQTRRLDDTYYLQKFTPRKKDSLWSEVNRLKALDLITAGRMQPAGLAAIARAKTNGRWESAYASASKATVPDDLRTALDANPDAATFFGTLNAQNRYAVLFRVQTAKRAETRAARVAQLVAMLARGEKFHP